jgi:hypothetical protein
MAKGRTVLLLLLLLQVMAPMVVEKPLRLGKVVLAELAVVVVVQQGGGCTRRLLWGKACELAEGLTCCAGSFTHNRQQLCVQ